VSTAGVMRNTGIIINRDFGRLQEEIILCFKFPFQHLPGGPEKKKLKQKEYHFRIASDSTNTKQLL
jgi:hypothetical protein